MSIKIHRDEGGAVAIVFALAVVPIIALMAGAVDFSRQRSVEAALQDAADASVLAAAQYMQEHQNRRDRKASKRAAEARATQVFQSNFRGRVEDVPAKLRFSFRKEQVAVSARSRVSTAFLSVIGMNTLKVAAYAQADVPKPRDLEIVFVLDYSKSMEENSKYVRMASAAQAFIEKLGARSRDDKIGVVPFSDFVYGRMTGENLRGVPANNYRKPMTGCVTNRDYPYAASDEAPTKTLEASRWPVADASADCQVYADNDLKIRELTSDLDGVAAAIQSMKPVYLTNISLGAEMGWHLLSPNEPFTAASPYSDSSVQKVLVLLSDGAQTVEASGADGFSTAAADANTVELCAGMRTVGIDVYAIAYDVAEEGPRALLSGCAGDAGHYFDATNASDISDVFDRIYASILDSVHLSR